MRFRTKIMLCVMLILSMAFSIGGSLLISMSFRSSLENERDNALSSYRMILYTLEAASASGTSDLNSAMSDILSQLDSRADRSWTALYLSDLSGEEGGIYDGSMSVRFRESTISADAEHCVTTLFAGDDGGHYLQINGEFLAGDVSTYSLEALYDISAVYTARDSQIRIYRWVFAFVTLAGVIASWLMASWLTKPLRRLSLTARAVAGGDLDSRALIKGGDEVGDLAGDFNLMTQRLQDKIQEQQDDMRRQEEFMGSFAHELKTPMTSVIGYADLLRGRDLDEDEKREAANYIFNEGRRLEGLSIKLLDLLVLKKHDFPLTVSSPKALLGEVAQTVAPSLYRAGIRLRCRGEEGVCLLEPDLVKSLMTNLIDNARKAMDGGGVIRAEVYMLPDGCAFTVTDQGRGMTEEEIARVTEAFYRVDKARSRAQGGAGLGLSLCSEIVRLHGGAMEFKSEPGRGTCVTATLRGGAADE